MDDGSKKMNGIAMNICAPLTPWPITAQLPDTKNGEGRLTRPSS